MNKKHVISITDLSLQDVIQVLDLARQIKQSPAKYKSKLEGSIFGLIFEKPSTRTRISFEAGIKAMGGGVIYVGPEVKLGVREEIRDVARVMDRYLSGLVLRTFSHNTIMEFCKYFNGVIVNGLSDFEHPCQILGDFMTLSEKFPEGVKPRLAYVGDGNNVFNSLLLLSSMMGLPFQYATPEANKPQEEVLQKAKNYAAQSGASIFGCFDPVQAVKQADVIYTDVWVSMGEEAIREEKIRAFSSMQINSDLLKHASKDVKVMHCLPAHRGEEITDEVMEGPHSIIFDQAENRLHVQKALLLYLLKL